MKKSDTFGYDHGAFILKKELMLAHGEHHDSYAQFFAMTQNVLPIDARDAP